MEPQPYFALLLAVLISSCNPDLKTDPPQGDGNITVEGRAYEGALYFDSCFSGGFARLDLATGDEELVLSDDDLRRISVSPSSTKMAAQDTSKLLYILDSVNTDESFRLSINQSFSGFLLFNRDSSLFLISEKNSTGTDYLRVRDASSLLNEHVDRDYPSAYFQSYAWIDNDSYVFSSGESIYRVDGVSSKTITLLISEPGYVFGHLSVSPDEAKLAYTKAPGATPWNEEADVYISNIDGTDEKTLTVNSSLRNTHWSPDSRYLAVAAGSYHGGFDYYAGFFPEIYIIDTTATSALTVNYGQGGDSTLVKQVSSSADAQGGYGADFKHNCIDGNVLFWNEN